MTVATPPLDPARSRLRAIAFSPTLLWVAFILVHVWLGYLNISGVQRGFGDVEFVYKQWAENALRGGYWVGITVPWVYPIVALVPILFAASFGFPLYGSTWLGLVLVLDIIGFAALVGWGRSRESTRIGWWWVAFLLLVGPIALSRIDSITIPMAIVGVVLLAKRPAVTTVILTVATWIKIWPVALLTAILIASKARVRVVIAAVVTSLVIIVFAIMLGSGANVLSFVTQQTGRGLQIEAPVSTLWMWLAAFHVPGAGLYYDTKILTFQVHGRGVGLAAELMTPLLALAVITVCVLGIVALRRGIRVADLLGPLSLALVAALIAFNKVGSPQFINWLAVPVILGLSYQAFERGPSFRVPASLVLEIAVLTQVIYPTLYDELLLLDPWMVLVLTLRNVLLFVLLGWAVWQLIGLAERHDATVGSQSPGDKSLKAQSVKKRPVAAQSSGEAPAAS